MVGLDVALAIGGVVAPILWEKIDKRLTKTEIQEALKAGISIANQEEEKLEPQCHLFYRSPQDGWQSYSNFLNQFFSRNEVQQELLKPLQNQGLPEINLLVAAFKQEAESHAKIKPQEERIEPWLKAFIGGYSDKTGTYLRFQVAKEDYFEQLAKWYDNVKFAGIAVPGEEVEKSAQLDNIFVMPDVREEGRSRTDRWLDAELFAEATDSRQLALLQQQRQWAQSDSRFGNKTLAQGLLNQNQSRKLVILGAPGSGKTTLMSYFAVMLAHKEPNKLGLSADTDWLPILIRIRDLTRKPELSVLEYVRLFAEKTLMVKQLPEGFFEYWLEDGRTLILLDGLDEVAESGKRHEVVKRIENFLGQFQQNRAIITSRPAGYRRDFFHTEEFPHYWLQSFDDDKIEEFINRWYDSRVTDKEEAKRRKESLRKALNANERIKLLARNPLLLTIITLIHRYQAYLPKERHKLYDKAVETLLTSWDANKELSHESKLNYLKLDDLRRLLAILACWIHQQGSTGDKEGGTLIDKEELMEQLSREIRTLKQVQLYQAQEEAERFVNFMRERTGLLNEQGQDCYAFVHKTFQEYLCAEEIDYQADNEEDFEIILDCICEHLHDSHWEEVLLLLIAQQKPKKAAKAIQIILNRDSEYEQWLHRDLLFAGACLAEDIKGLQVVEGNLVQEILQRLVELEVSDSKQIGEKIRQQVFEILCSFNETELEAQALQLLKDKADRIGKGRLNEYRAALGEKEAVIKIYLARFQDENSHVRYQAAAALGKLGEASEMVITALLARLQDKDSLVRYQAAEALGNLGEASEMVVTALLARLQDEDSTVGWMDAEALGKLGEASEMVITALLARLQDEDSAVRILAAVALGNLGKASEAVITALLARLQDENSVVRVLAAHALGKLGEASEAVITALLARLQDEDSTVRVLAAAAALSKLGEASEMVVTALLASLQDKVFTVRWRAAEALGNLGEASEMVITALLAGLQDEDSYVRFLAAAALGKLGEASEVVITALLARLQNDDPYMRYRAAEALGNLGEKSDKILPQVVQWIEQHQDSEYVGSGIDALWDLVVGGQS